MLGPVLCPWNASIQGTFMHINKSWAGPERRPHMRVWERQNGKASGNPLSLGKPPHTNILHSSRERQWEILLTEDIIKNKHEEKCLEEKQTGRSYSQRERIASRHKSETKRCLRCLRDSKTLPVETKLESQTPWLKEIPIISSGDRISFRS